MFLKGFNENTKNESYTQADPETGKMETLLDGAFHLDDHPTKSKDANKLIFTKETFQDFPDLYLANNGDFQQAIKMTDANPQQSEYLWGTIELVKWNAPDGHSLEGLLVKPGNFDPAKKYPMIVNFYERSSDGLYTHRAPFPTGLRLTTLIMQVMDTSYLIPILNTKSGTRAKVPTMQSYQGHTQ